MFDCIFSILQNKWWLLNCFLSICVVEWSIRKMEKLAPKNKDEEAREDYNTYQLESMAETLQYELENILGSCVNRIYVM